MIENEQSKKRWQAFSLIEQMGNIGSEVGRTAKWHGKDERNFWGAATRAIELFDLTLEDARWKRQKGEIGKAKEVFCDAVLGGDEYKSTLFDLEKYCMQFAYLAQNK